MSEFTELFLADSRRIIDGLEVAAIDAMVARIVAIREAGGRLFFVGVGGGAGHASHAVNDFRKIAGIESYTPTDNVSELTARINDEGWEGAFAAWLRGSRLGPADGVFVFSVGGGDEERGVSLNIVAALRYAREVGAAVLGVVGRDGGVTARLADACVVVPMVNATTVTPQTEGFQALIWHLVISHPDLQRFGMAWETLGGAPHPSPVE